MHNQTIPAQTLFWEHNIFEGRRIGSPSSPEDEAALRWWGVSYGAYSSLDDAKWLRNPVLPHIVSRVRGKVMDRFFFDAATQKYSQTEAQVYACVRWMFTGNPTESELPLTENLELCRARMAGAVLFPGPYEFTALELPAERAPEVE